MRTPCRRLSDHLQPCCLPPDHSHSCRRTIYSIAVDRMAIHILAADRRTFLHPCSLPPDSRTIYSLAADRRTICDIALDRRAIYSLAADRWSTYSLAADSRSIYSLTVYLSDRRSALKSTVRPPLWYCC